jgi:membrane associated rhomboid family serine protease
MIPIRDVIPSRTTPVVTIGLIAINAVVFLSSLALTDDERMAWFATYGLVPAEFSMLSLVTSMFLHAGWAHAAGNLLSLWIFGDNVEDLLGHARFFVFYLATGAAAALAETWANPLSTVPLVGASGAIAGVMGAYLAMFPGSRVLVLLFLFLYVDVVEVPAVVFLTLWFLLQLVGGVGRTGAEGGVAFWAHAGGFLAGLLVALASRPSRRARHDWGG